MTPFCDWVSTSAARDDCDALVSQLVPVIDAAGGFLDSQDAIASNYRLGDGTIRARHSHGVFCVSASGDALSQLRSRDVYGEFLAALGSVPHRVTCLHATLDVATHAPPIVASAAEKGRAGLIALSRKAVPPTQVQTFLALDAFGSLTGTVYIGSAQAEVRAAVYDKRHQRMCAGHPDPGPLLRYEVRCRSKLGVTLRDASEPERVFFHFAAPDLLPLPQDVHPWSPHGEGFALEKRKVFTPAELLERRLEASGDVKRLLELAAECGPHGLDYLVSKLRKLAATRVPGQPQAAERPQAVTSGLTY